MNAKKVKTLRKQLKSYGYDPRETKYGRGGVGQTSTVKVSPDCGRGFYLRSKKIVRDIGLPATLAFIAKGLL